MPSLPKRFQLDLTGEKPVIVETKTLYTIAIYDVQTLGLSEDRTNIFISGVCTEITILGALLSFKRIEEKYISLSKLDIKGKADTSGLDAIYSYFNEIGQDYEIYDFPMDEDEGSGIIGAVDPEAQ